MKKFAMISLSVLAGATALLGIVAAQHVPVLPENSKVGEVAVGGLNYEDAITKVKAWWGARQMDPITLNAKGLRSTLQPRKPFEFGLKLDAEASVRKIPLATFTEELSTKVGLSDADAKTEFVWLLDEARVTALAKFVEQNREPATPAKVTFANGAIKLKPEVSTIELDRDALLENLVKATMTGEESTLPVKEAPKTIPDDELKKIQHVMASFTTKFSASNRPRSSNIRLASSKIDGTIIMPGESFSYNETVGQRTIKNGFQEAGVFVNGRHDTGVGGGICQVSTTLYNASLLANMPILQRRSHSLPVPYVPVGRDATVDWGSADFKFKNDKDFPIAVSTFYKPGELTVRLLGVKDPTLKIEFATGARKYWANGVRQVRDASLPLGKTVIEEKGSGGQSVTVYRLVYQNGKLVKRESLGQSIYGGSPRVIRVGTRKVAARVAPAVPAAPPASAPATGAADE
ncbi:MAG: VanW family protein [Chthonomonas sp.]|nr:VanW family protein [Chthonomonas sp.]